jgi:hypothetical protein
MFFGKGFRDGFIYIPPERASIARYWDEFVICPGIISIASKTFLVLGAEEVSISSTIFLNFPSGLATTKEIICPIESLSPS